MTAIAAVAHRGRVWIAGDSALVCDDRVIYTASPKVWRVGEMVVGAAGDVAYLAAIGRVQWPNRAQDSWPRIREALEAAGVPPDEGECLIGHRGKLWEATTALYPIAGTFAAIGTGAAYCVGALAVSRLDPPARVREAVRVARDHCTTVGGRIVVVST